MPSLKILFCGQGNPSKVLGGSKVIVELAEAMIAQGWCCDIASRDEVMGYGSQKSSYAEALCEYLKTKSGNYDVVDYDHQFLPYPRNLFSQSTLMVARAVLLAQHFDVIPIPRGRFLKSRLRTMFMLGREKAEWKRRIDIAQTTVMNADLVNVANDGDKAELVKRGIAEESIVVLPYGIGQDRMSLFSKVSTKIPDKPKIAFVGTFDYRKGAREFPRIVDNILRKIPDASFRLLGTAGMFQDRISVLRHFPKQFHSKIEVIPRFEPNELPDLLSECSIGIFPSHVEGFGFGVLEMLAAAVPVFAYDAPGPPMMLPDEFLVPRGDAVLLADKVVRMLEDHAGLSVARIWAQDQSKKFQWQDIASQTIDIYQTRVDTLRHRLANDQSGQT